MQGQDVIAAPVIVPLSSVLSHRMLRVPGKAPCSREAPQGGDGEPNLQWDKLCELEFVESKAKALPWECCWKSPQSQLSQMPVCQAAPRLFMELGRFSQCATAWIPGLDLQTVDGLRVQVTAVSPVCQGIVGWAPKSQTAKEKPWHAPSHPPGENSLHKETVRE